MLYWLSGFNQTGQKKQSRHKAARENKYQKSKEPNRAERRKAMLESKSHPAASSSSTTTTTTATTTTTTTTSHHAAHSANTLPNKKIQFDNDKPVVSQSFSKPTNNSFQSKPVVNNSTRSNQHKEALNTYAVDGKEWKESGVHPSWAAKQLSKPQIVEGKGKKITFDD